MTWQNPEWAPLVAAALLAVGAVALLSYAVARRRARRLLGATRSLSRAALARELALLGAFAAIGIAALGPQLGLRTLRLPGSGADVVLLVDVSRSMEADDVPPSRLAHARRIAREVLARLEPDDRSALAVYADRGVVLVPLTPDADALAELVDALEPGMVEPRGSDLGAGLAAALGAFEAASERPRVLLVIGDGEDADARPAVAGPLRRANARIVAVALGTEAGAAVPDGGAPLADGGRTVVTRRDAARFEALAEATGGLALRADRWGEVELGALVAALRRDAAKASDGMIERRVPADRSVPFVALALALLVFESLAAARWKATGRASFLARRAAVTTIAALALALAGLASATAADDAAIAWLEAHLRAHPGDARALVALGVARAEADRLDEAAHALRAAAVGAARREDAALAYYDLGVVELERERFAAARDAFLDALALAPDDAEARFNLEWAARALASQPPDAARKRADDEASAEDERPDPRQPDPEAPPGRSPRPPPPGTLPPSELRPDAARNFAPELSPDRVEAWLDAVGDDPGRGLRDAARGPRRARAAGPRW